LEQIVVSILVSMFSRGARLHYVEWTEEMRAEADRLVEIHLRSLDDFGEGIYGGLYGDGTQGLDSAFARVAMWITIASGIYFFGQLFRPDEPYLRWNFSVFKEHCRDCVRLDGQVHTASEWRASGWYPRSFGLECHGVHCGCYFTDAAGPSSGGF
jgi:hypothetical protein